MRTKTLLILNDFYYGNIPNYVKNSTKTYVEFLIDNKREKITMKDVMEYYLTQANNITSGCRKLSNIVGDWRNIDYLAKEILEWFKYSNIETLRKESKKIGLTPKF